MPFANTNCWRNVRSPPRFSTKSCRVCRPLWPPLSRPCRGKPSRSMPRPMSAACCRNSLERKNVESIAYHAGQNRLGLQGFIGWADWADAPLRQTLLDQVGQQLGQGDGVLVFDPSAFPKSGRESVGVALQWCRRLGKVHNCQAAIYLGYVSAQATPWLICGCICPKHAPRIRRGCTKRGCPKPTEATAPVTSWRCTCSRRMAPCCRMRGFAGDDEMGRPYWFRRRLAGLANGICWQCPRTR